MNLREVVQSLAMALMKYRGEKTRHFKKKNEIARQLLLTIIKTNLSIQDTRQLRSEMIVIYNMLNVSYNKLIQLKGNSEGTLDSIINTHINQFEAIMFNENSLALAATVFSPTSLRSNLYN